MSTSANVEGIYVRVAIDSGGVFSSRRTTYLGQQESLLTGADIVTGDRQTER